MEKARSLIAKAQPTNPNERESTPLVEPETNMVSSTLFHLDFSPKNAHKEPEKIIPNVNPPLMPVKIPAMMLPPKPHPKKSEDSNYSK